MTQSKEVVTLGGGVVTKNEFLAASKDVNFYFFDINMDIRKNVVE